VVSNSSWANFGYLVASELVGVDTMKELRILSSLHGIGFHIVFKVSSTVSLTKFPRWSLTFSSFISGILTSHIVLLLTSFLVNKQ